MIHIRLQPGRFAEVVIVLALATNLIGFAGLGDSRGLVLSSR